MRLGRSLLPDPPILVITNRLQCEEALEARAKQLFQGGCRWLSVREKDLEPKDRLSLLRRLIAIGRPFGAQVGVHGDLDASKACAAPLHLPAGANSAEIRRAVGDDIFIGQSCHSQADALGATGADYITVSPVFASASKPGYEPVLSLHDFAVIARRSPAPVLALGGVAANNLLRLRDAAVSGIAVMGEAMRVSDPERWFHDLATRWAAL